MSDRYQAQIAKLLQELKHVRTRDKNRLIGILENSRDLYNAWLKYQIVENRRTDILAEAVLNYTIVPGLHSEIIRHQWTYPNGQILIFRGAGKTTIATITRAIHLLILNPNLRILIASKTLTNAQDFLKEIKSHFESNEKFREIFGNYVGKRQWDETSIEIAPRTIGTKEPTINTVGVDGAVASKHYDIVIADDLVEEANSRTDHMRKRVKKWYYNVLIPVLEPPDPTVLYRGLLTVTGTRYHPEDLYDHLKKNELKDSTLVIPALNQFGESVWPRKFSTSFLKKKRDDMGTFIFNAQYQCDCQAMEGEMFRWDDFQVHPESEFPSIQDMQIYQGVDLAISEKEKNDCFAQVIIGVKKDTEGTDHFWVLDWDEGHYRFNEQTERILKLYSKHGVFICGVESNAYQKAQIHNLKAKNPNLKVLPINTVRDKITRGWKLASYFETGRVHFKKKDHKFIDHLLRFPHAKKKDLFDALDFAIFVATRRKKKRRAKLGLL